MLQKMISWLLFFLLFIEGSYLKVLFSRTDYGRYGANLACDTVFLMYGLSLTTLTMALVLFLKTKPMSYVYSACLIMSSAMMITFFTMNATEIIVGIGDGVEGSGRHYFCSRT